MRYQICFLGKEKRIKDQSVSQHCCLSTCSVPVPSVGSGILVRNEAHSHGGSGLVEETNTRGRNAERYGSM